MKNLKKLALVLLLTPLFAACSSGPSDSTVEGLIEAQYEQMDSAMDDVVAGAGNDEMVQAMSGMMPKLESVDNISCDTTDGENTYMCTAEVTQSINGNSRMNKGGFRVYKINDEWVLGN
ncbi:hypothetical protein [Psychrobacter sp.]|uniref:hypothetical protein n=1 Tax=unclassified Psychrobacter TaxID=196806 RepID=UPI003F9D83EF